MGEREFISVGRPLRHAFVYIPLALLLILFGVMCVTTKGSVLAIVLGVFLLVIAFIVTVSFFLFKKVASEYENIKVKNDIFVISPIKTIDQIELYSDDITSIEFFVLPVLNDGNKDSSNFNNQVRFNTIDERYIVYCSNKKEFKEFVEKFYPEKIA